MTLNEAEYAVAITRSMGMKGGKETYDYIEKNYHIRLDKNDYYKIMGKMEAKAIQEMEKIANTLPIIHAERIREFEFLKDGCYQDLQLTEDPYKRVLIRMKIAELHQYISQLQTMTRRVIEKYVTKEVETRIVSI